MDSEALARRAPDNDTFWHKMPKYVTYRCSICPIGSGSIGR